MQLFAHPFSSYCQKVLIALYENRFEFELRLLGAGEDATATEFAALWPLQRMPVLVDAGRTVVESSVIIEYLGLRHPTPVQLVPVDPLTALEVRFMDRFFDNYVMTPMQRIVFDFLRPSDQRNAADVRGAEALLDTAYAWLEMAVADRRWAAGDEFSLADCAAAPSLFYADWVRPIEPRYRNLRALRRRLLERPSFARAVDEARPYRHLFPPGAPERD